MEIQKINFYAYGPSEIGEKVFVRDGDKKFHATVIKCDRVIDDWLHPRFEITIELDEPLEVSDIIAYSSRGV